jgi:hypothetical protein
VYTKSTGNFIIQNSVGKNELFEAFLQVGKYVKDTNQWGWEQTTMNLIYSQTNLAQYISILDHKYLNSVPQDLMTVECWKNRQTIKYPWDKTHFLTHITGIPNQDRIHILKTTFKGYLQ